MSSQIKYLSCVKIIDNLFCENAVIQFLGKKANNSKKYFLDLSPKKWISFKKIYPIYLNKNHKEGFSVKKQKRRKCNRRLKYKKFQIICFWG